MPTADKTCDFAVEWWPITRPKPYPKNARKWTGKAVEKLAASIREFGWRQPLVCDVEDVIVIGHLRLAAAQSLGLEQVPVHVARDLSPAKIRALRPGATFCASHDATGHVAAFPVGLPQFFVLAYTDPDDIVCDPFAGSGSTIIAAEKNQRRGYGIELNPLYCDVIVQRWQNFTGREATLDGHGATFAHVAAGRAMEAEDAIKEDCLRLLEERA